MLIWNILYCQKNVPLNYISTLMCFLKLFAMLMDTNLHYLKVALLQGVILYSLIDVYQSLKETYLYQQVAL
jgi:hypothetical protein